MKQTSVMRWNHDQKLLGIGCFFSYYLCLVMQMLQWYHVYQWVVEQHSTIPAHLVAFITNITVLDWIFLEIISEFLTPPPMMCISCWPYFFRAFTCDFLKHEHLCSICQSRAVLACYLVHQCQWMGHNGNIHSCILAATLWIPFVEPV